MAFVEWIAPPVQDRGKEPMVSISPNGRLSFNHAACELVGIEIGRELMCRIEFDPESRTLALIPGGKTLRLTRSRANHGRVRAENKLLGGALGLAERASLAAWRNGNRIELGPIPVTDAARDIFALRPAPPMPPEPVRVPDDPPVTVVETSVVKAPEIPPPAIASPAAKVQPPARTGTAREKVQEVIRSMAGRDWWRVEELMAEVESQFSGMGTATVRPELSVACKSDPPLCLRRPLDRKGPVTFEYMTAGPVVDVVKAAASPIHELPAGDTGGAPWNDPSLRGALEQAKLFGERRQLTSVTVCNSPFSAYKISYPTVQSSGCIPDGFEPYIRVSTSGSGWVASLISDPANFITLDAAYLAGPPKPERKRGAVMIDEDEE